MLKYADFLRITDFENGNRYLNSFLGQQMGFLPFYSSI